MFIEIAAPIIPFALGIITGKYSMRYKNRLFDLCLMILAVLFTWIGTNTFLIKMFNFQIRLSECAQLILFGMIIRRALFFMGLTKKSKNQ